MARRLTPEARRAEIIDATQAAIASDGYRGLSLREIARRCGMSAPGLMHYFPDMPTLLEAVLDHRDEVDLAEILDDGGFDVPLLEMLDAARGFYAAHPDEARSFDALEAEALDPGHPAHEYFARRSERTFDLMVPQIEREFEDGDEVARILRLLLDGVRLKRLRDPEVNWTDTDDDWRVMRKLLDGFPRRGIESDGD
ncbi:TetR/AcrR family transcriptional regulator [Agromyces laixinhei]|uniref:TetR/AcrR family transcriptional regulator n=1 Tax=Agromyces laixinhei TaxID=2585717 RepID=UPI0018DD9F0A|nr:TetR/AcrR family transcriptional regulator [Agromyces laixinhei]